MRISKLLLLSLAAAAFLGTQVASAQDAFQHLPAMPLQGPQTKAPVRMPAPKPLVVRAPVFASRQCAIPLLNVTPDNTAHYPMQTVAPPASPVGAMVYVQTPPVCGESESAKASSNFYGPVKK